MLLLRKHTKLRIIFEIPCLPRLNLARRSLRCTYRHEKPVQTFPSVHQMDLRPHLISHLISLSSFSPLSFPPWAEAFPSSFPAWVEAFPLVIPGLTGNLSHDCPSPAILSHHYPTSPNCHTSAPAWRPCLAYRGAPQAEIGPWRRSFAVLAQVGFLGLDLRHHRAQNRVSRRRSPPFFLTCANNRHHLRPK